MQNWRGGGKKNNTVLKKLNGFCLWNHVLFRLQKIIEIQWKSGNKSYVMVSGWQALTETGQKFEQDHDHYIPIFFKAKNKNKQNKTKQTETARVLSCMLKIVGVVLVSLVHASSSKLQFLLDLVKINLCVLFIKSIPLFRSACARSIESHYSTMCMLPSWQCKKPCALLVSMSG